MTDRHDFDELDELASAHLDGATTAEEAARVEADPALRARVEALRGVREQLRAAAATDVSSDAARRDAAIAAALRHADDPLLADVTPIAGSRAGWRRPAIRWVAAGALLAAATGGVLVSMDQGDSEGDEDLAATMAEESGDGGDSSADPRAADDAESDAAAGSAESALSTTTADLSSPMMAAALVDLGPAPTAEALADAASGALAATTLPPGTVTPTDQVSSCLAEATTGAAPQGTVALSAVAVLDELPVLVVVVDEADGSRVLTAYDPAAACTEVLRTTL